MYSIVFYGASVTQQGGDSGYCSHLISSNTFELVRQYGIGGCHFNDAGYYLLDEAIGGDSFDLCLLDWNSTWLDTFDSNRLESVVKRLLERRILPVFAILPTKLNSEIRPSELLVIEYSRQHCIPLIDLRPEFDLDLMLRDEYHTNEIGARYIAQSIQAFLMDLNVTQALESVVLSSLNNDDGSGISLYQINRRLQLDDVLSIELNRFDPHQPIDLTIDMTIGPFSSFMGMSHDGVKVSTYQIWDLWCHYERRKLFQVIDIKEHVPIPLKLELFVEPGEVDYSVCRRSDFAFNGAHELKIDRIYSTNLKLSIG
jgi:hypothetical protein